MIALTVVSCYFLYAMKRVLKRLLSQVLGWPFLLLSLFLLAAVIKSRLDEHARRFDRAAGEVTAYYNRQLAHMASSVAALAAHPHADRLAAQSAASVAGREERDLSAAWDTLDPEDARLRPIFNNAVAENLRHYAAQWPWLDGLFLTDARGAVIAAAAKPEYFSYAETDIWILAKSRMGRRPVSTGIRAGGHLDIAVQLPSAGGILMASCRLTEPEDRAAWSIPENMLVAAGNQTPILLHGPPEKNAVLSGLIRSFQDTVRRGGIWKDYRYQARMLDGGLTWMRPQWIVACRDEPSMPAAALTAAAVTGLVLILIYLIAWSTAYYIIGPAAMKPLGPPLFAGQWILRRALPESEYAARIRDGEDAGEAHGELERMLEEWYGHFGKSMEEHVLAQSQEMQRDLTLAKEFQQAFLNRPYPAVPAVHTPGRIRLEFCHQYHPALALGGDFFDVIRLGANSAGILLADVMGHGTRSALITSMIRTICGDLATQGRHATHFLQEMNRQFTEMLSTMPSPLFASAFFFVADTTARMATYASAGHPAPFHIHRHMGRISRLEVPPPRGAALGLIPDENYTGGHCRLVPGDSFIFFTDGVYEAHNENDEEFGIERIEQVLKDNMYHSLRDMVDTLKQSVLDFTGKVTMDDDICIIGMHVTTQAENESDNDS